MQQLVPLDTKMITTCLPPPGHATYVVLDIARGNCPLAYFILRLKSQIFCQALASKHVPFHNTEYGLRRKEGGLERLDYTWDRTSLLHAWLATADLNKPYADMLTLVTAFSKQHG